jgi:hypothetical protein
MASAKCCNVAFHIADNMHRADHLYQIAGVPLWNLPCINKPSDFWLAVITNIIPTYEGMKGFVVWEILVAAGPLKTRTE